MLGGRARKGHEAMTLDWMTSAERDQAIPPAYTRYIGEQALRCMEAQAVRRATE